MSKKLTKFLLFSAAAGASAYGAYYYLQKKDYTAPQAKDEDADDDFDDFSEDLDEDLPPTKGRSYVSLNLDKAEAFATEAFQKAKVVIADSVQQVKDTVKSVTEAQASKDVVVDIPTEDVTIEEVAEEVSEAAEETKNAVENLAEDTAEAAEDIFEDVAEKAQETVSNVMADIENAIENLSKEIYSDSDSTIPTHVPGSETIEEFFDDDDEISAN